MDNFTRKVIIMTKNEIGKKESHDCKNFDDTKDDEDCASLVLTWWWLKKDFNNKKKSGNVTIHITKCMKETKNELNTKPSQWDHIHKLTTHTWFSKPKSETKDLYMFWFWVFTMYTKTTTGKMHHHNFNSRSS